MFDQTAFEKAESYEEKLAVHQRHWQDVQRLKQEQLRALQQAIQTPFECCGTLWESGGMCPACHTARIF